MIPQKWVYCGNEWRQVSKLNCPMVYVDPDFSEHRSFCSPQGLLSGGGDYPYDGTIMWLFDPIDNPRTLYRFCQTTLPCFCPACYE